MNPAPYNYSTINLDVSSGLDDYELEITGSKFIYLQGTNNIDVKIGDVSNDAIPLSPKDQINVGFNKLYISAQAYSETIILLVLDPSTMDIRSNLFNADKINEVVTVNTVTQVDKVTQIENDIPFYTDSLNGKTALRCDIFTPTAGNYGLIHVWNPAGSGKLVVVDSIVITGNGIIRAYVYLISSVNGTGPNYFHYKNVGYGNSIIGTYLYDSTITPANSLLLMSELKNQNIIQSKPLILPEGKGISINGEVSSTIETCIEITEI